MKNLLCTPALESEGRTRAAGVSAEDDGTRVYWYGKSPARRMRKLGHITATGESATAARELVKARWHRIQKEALEA